MWVVWQKLLRVEPLQVSELKVIISRQFYFEISGIRLEGGKHINSKEKQSKQSLTDS